MTTEPPSVRSQVEHVNSEGERITLADAPDEFPGCQVLIVHDDPPPRGSGIGAPTLITPATAAWLVKQMRAVGLLDHG